MEAGGAYSANRAAALSGVPWSTIHYWARTRVLVPSVSPDRTRLWSFADLLGLRVIYWLRQPKSIGDGQQIPPTTMPAVRRALGRLRELDLGLFEDGRPAIAVDRAGRIHLSPPGESPETVPGQKVGEQLLDLLAPYRVLEGIEAPDLFRPRPRLRIIPRKLSGAPHVVDTRVETQALYALASRGFGREKIAELYPDLDDRAIADALGLEEQLARNLALRAA